MVAIVKSGYFPKEGMEFCSYAGRVLSRKLPGRPSKESAENLTRIRNYAKPTRDNNLADHIAGNERRY
jgi:hypothetical protein